MIDIVSINTPEYKSKTYIIAHRESHHSIVIDPTVSSLIEINNYLLKNGLFIDYVIPTHGHFDHIEGIGKLREMFKFDLIANMECSIALGDPKRNYSFYYEKKNVSLPSPDILFNEDIYNFRWNDIQIKIIKTPGHSPCSVCILVDGIFLFSGDTILLEYNPFSKFPDGNAEQLKASIKKIYSTFPHSLVVYPGHGDSFLLGSIVPNFNFL